MRSLAKQSGAVAGGDAVFEVVPAGPRSRRGHPGARGYANGHAGGRTKYAVHPGRDQGNASDCAPSPRPGTILLANLNALHWDPERFPHPFHFKPERYLNHLHRSAVYAAGGDILARDHFTFGAGRRICPGIHLAENGLFLAVANIIWAYEFKLPLDDQGEEIPLDITDEGFMEGAIRVPKQYTVRILERNAARSRLIRSEWDQAQQA
ncbi:O-methylsterigmatocystin oxidoreductase, partial [Aspergillus flavus]